MRGSAKFCKAGSAPHLPTHPTQQLRCSYGG